MRVLFVVRSLAHLPYHAPTLQALVREGAVVTLVADAAMASDFSTEADAAGRAVPGMRVEPLVRRQGLTRRVLFAARELRSYASYLARPDQSPFYEQRWRQYVARSLQLPLRSRRVRRLLARPQTRTWIERLESYVWPAANVVRHVAEHRPDVLVISPMNMRFSEEVEYAKAAKQLRIPTVLPVLSWDNLTTKGLIHVQPDVLLAWNEAQRQEAVTIHGVPFDRTVVTGSPFFDKWFDRGLGAGGDRESHLSRIGLEAGAPLVLYLGSSANIARDESWLVRALDAAMRNHPDQRVRRAGLLVRPHPANAGIYQDLALPHVRVWPRAGLLPSDHDSIRDFAASLQCADLAVGINTTGMIDAVIRDVPTAALRVREYASTQVQAQHFQHLWQSGALEDAPTAESVADILSHLLDGLDRQRSQRREFVRQFVRPLGPGVSAGGAAAQAIAHAAARIPAPLIEQNLTTAAHAASLPGVS